MGTVIPPEKGDEKTPAPAADQAVAKAALSGKVQSFFQAHKEAIIRVGAAVVLFLAAYFLS